MTLDNLDEDAFVHILTEPKNALTKQYEYLFALDDVVLEFTDDALRAIAQSVHTPRMFPLPHTLQRLTVLVVYIFRGSCPIHHISATVSCPSGPPWEGSILS